MNEKLLTNRFRLYCDALFPKIKPKNGKYMGNYHCHHNCKQLLTDKKCDAVALAIMFDKNHPIVHFLGVKGKKYIEATLGYRAEENDYYLVKVLHNEETENMDLMLLQAKKYFIRQNFNLIERLFFGINCESI